MAKIKLSLSRLTTTELLTFTQQVYTAMNANTAFASLNTQLGSLNTSAGDLSTKNGQYLAVTQGKLQLRTERDALRDTLEATLAALAAGVESVTGGDPAAIQSAGFDLRGPKAPVVPVAAPQNVLSFMGEMEGTIGTEWDPVNGAHSYVVECAQTPAGPWNQVGITTRSDYEAGGLTTGSKYWFRVRAVGAAGPGPWSDPTVKMAA